MERPVDRFQDRMWLLGQLDSLGTTQDPALQGRPFTPSGSKNTNDLDQYPSRPAVEFLRDMISRYRSLEWLPGGLYGKGEVQDDEGIDRYTSFGELYKTCGWPDRFDPLKFDQLRVEGGKKFDYWESSPKGPEEDKSYAVLEHFHNPIMVQAREIIQQQIHLVDATYRLEKQMYTDKWEQQRLQAQIWNTERTLQPMKTWEEDQARLRTELDFRASDLEALRTRTGRYAGSGWAGISDAQLRGLYEKAAADKRIANINALLNDQSADERAEREYREAKQAARDAPQEAWNAFAESFATWENDNWKDRWSILGSGTTVVDLRTVLDEDLSWQDLQRRIVYELEKNEDRSWKGKRLWRNNGGRVAAVLEH